MPDFVTAFTMVLKLIICAVVAFGGGYWVLSSWFDRRLSLTEAAVLVASLIVFLALGIPLALKSSVGFLFLLVLLAGAVALLFYYFLQVMNERAHRQMDEEDIAVYLEALDLDPTNIAAHSLLAKIYRKRGQNALALEHYEAALKLDPSLQEERFWVGRLKSMLAGAESAEPGAAPVDPLVELASPEWKEAIRDDTSPAEPPTPLVAEPAESEARPEPELDFGPFLPLGADAATGAGPREAAASDDGALLCHHCGAVVPPGDAKCEVCGQSVQKSQHE